MDDAPFSKRDIRRLKTGLKKFPDVSGDHIYKAQTRNADEAKRYMQALVPDDDGVTKSNTTATAYKNQSSGSIGFAMTTARPNQKSGGDKTERIRAILFANGTDFFYGCLLYTSPSPRD